MSEFSGVSKCVPGYHALAYQLVRVPGQSVPCQCGKVTFIVLCDYGLYWVVGKPERVE